MKLQQYSGVELVVEEKPKAYIFFDAGRLAFFAVLAVLGVLGSLFCFLTAFDINEIVNISFWSVTQIAVVTAICLILIFSIKKHFHWTSKLLPVLFCIAIIQFRNQLLYGICYLANIYIKEYNFLFSADFAEFQFGKGEINESVMLFLTFYIIAFIYIIMIGFIYEARLVIPTFIILPVFYLGFTVALLPECWALIILICFYVGVWVFRGIPARHVLEEKNFYLLQTYKSYSRQAIRSSLILILMTTCIGIFCYLFYKPEDYRFSPKMEYIKSEIQTFFEVVSTENIVKSITNRRLPSLNVTKQASGGISGGRLGNAEEIIYQQEVALELVTPSFQYPLYIKAYAGNGYQGNRWSETDIQYENLFENYYGKKTKKVWNSTVKQIMNSTYKKLTGEGYPDQEITVIKKGANLDYEYVPYFSKVESTEQYYMDLYANSTEEAQKKYKFIGVDLSQDFQDVLQKSEVKSVEEKQQEMLYRKFVYAAYTKLPQPVIEILKDAEGLDVIEKHYDSNYDADKSWKFLKEIRDEIIEKIQKDTVYTLSPGKLPKEKDFIEYFLYENKRGYCSHYASAAAVLFRARGVPARYVEGYSVRPEKAENNGVIQVLDSDAHAWVEVYVNDFGWIPVEVTPASRMDTLDSVNSAEIPIEEKKVEEETEPEAIPNVQTDTRKAEKKLEEKQQSEEEMKSYTFLIISVEILAAALIIFIIIRRKWMLNRRMQSFQTGSVKQISLSRVNYIFEMIEAGGIKAGNEYAERGLIEQITSLCEEKKKEEIELLYESIMKVQFSCSAITEQEMNVLSEWMEILKETIYKKSDFFHKLILKCIKNLY